jgi:flagellar basal body-associated protein FliL
VTVDAPHPTSQGRHGRRADETVNVEEFKLLSPRGREATLSYLRSLTFEEVSDPAKYASIKDEISKRMIESIGADKVHRILLVDFVLQ